MELKKKSKITFSLRPAPKFFSTFVIVIAIILVWRGLWILADAFIFPENPVLSAIVSALVGLVVLYLPDQDLKELL